MKGGMWGALFGVLGLMAGGYGAICGYMYGHQDSLIYPAGTVAVKPLPAPGAAGLADFRDVTLDTPDGQHLKAWWHPPQPGHGAVLYLHGNAGNIADPWRAERLRDLDEAGLGVLGLEYRGFGGSTGHPSEPGMITDAETAYDFIAKEAPGAKIAVFGDSLGTAVSIALATRRPVAGLMLDSPFASMVRMGQINYPWLPVAQLVRSKWESEKRVAKLEVPVVVALCQEDRVVPLAEGKRLFEAIPADNQNRLLITFPGCGHVQTWSQGAKGLFLNDLALWTTPTADTH